VDPAVALESSKIIMNAYRKRHHSHKVFGIFVRDGGARWYISELPPPGQFGGDIEFYMDKHGGTITEFKFGE
jgi:hypothetical protein